MTLRYLIYNSVDKDLILAAQQRARAATLLNMCHLAVKSGRLSRVQNYKIRRLCSQDVAEVVAVATTCVCFHRRRPTEAVVTRIVVPDLALGKWEKGDRMGTPPMTDVPCERTPHLRRAHTTRTSTLRPNRGNNRAFPRDGSPLWKSFAWESLATEQNYHAFRSISPICS